MGIRIDAAAYNVIGGRKNNEDNFYLNGTFLKREQMDSGGKASAQSTQNVQIYAVFDGMGGGKFGEQASFYAASRLREYQDGSEHIDNSENLRRFLTDTSKGIDRISSENNLRSGSCGSTAAILVIGDWWYRTAHVGDSRIYLLRNGQLRRITKDQSEVQRMVDAGRITLEEAWSHARKNVITHHLGMPLRTEQLQSIVGERMPLQVGDSFLICSDGVNDNLHDAEIRAAFDPARTAEENASAIARESVCQAQARRVESDNVTAVVVRVMQVADTEEAERRVRRLKIRQRLAASFTALFAAGTVGCAYMFLRTLF